MTTQATPIKLQYRLESGEWIDCDDEDFAPYDRTEEFMARCVEHNGEGMDREAVEKALRAGQQVRNSPDYGWADFCRCGNANPSRRSDDPGYNPATERRRERAIRDRDNMWDE